MADHGGQGIIFLAQAGHFSFEVAYLVLKAAHLGEHAGIRPANMAK